MFFLNIIRKFIPWNDTNCKIYNLYFKANTLYNKKKYFFSRFYKYKIYRKYNCIISPSAKIGEGLMLPHPTAIVIGDKVQIGKNVTIYQNVTCGQKKDFYPSICDGAVIYAGAIIIGNVKIGKNAIVGANAVVLNDVNDSEIVAGVPAKVVGRRK